MLYARVKRFGTTYYDVETETYERLIIDLDETEGFKGVKFFDCMRYMPFCEILEGMEIKTYDELGMEGNNDTPKCSGFVREASTYWNGQTSYYSTISSLNKELSSTHATRIPYSGINYPYFDRGSSDVFPRFQGDGDKIKYGCLGYYFDYNWGNYLKNGTIIQNTNPTYDKQYINSTAFYGSSLFIEFANGSIVFAAKNRDFVFNNYGKYSLTYLCKNEELNCIEAITSPEWIYSSAMTTVSAVGATSLFKELSLFNIKPDYISSIYDEESLLKTIEEYEPDSVSYSYDELFKPGRDEASFITKDNTKSLAFKDSPLISNLQACSVVANTNVSIYENTSVEIAGEKLLSAQEITNLKPFSKYNVENLLPYISFNNQANQYFKDNEAGYKGGDPRFYIKQKPNLLKNYYGYWRSSNVVYRTGMSLSTGGMHEDICHDFTKNDTLNESILSSTFADTFDEDSYFYDLFVSTYKTKAFRKVPAYNHEFLSLYDPIVTLEDGTVYDKGVEAKKTFYKNFFTGITDGNKNPDGGGEEGGGNLGPDSGPAGGAGSWDGTSDAIDKPSLPTLSGLTSGFVRTYAPTQTEISGILGSVYTEGFFESITGKMSGNYLEAIVSLQICYAPITTSGTKEVVIGEYGTGVNSSTVSSQFQTINCGSINVKEYYGSFLDYAPHTKISIALPFCGTFPLKANEVMNSQINVSYNVDVLSGSCVAFVKILKGNLNSVIYSFNGNCNIQIPFTSSTSVGNYTALLSAGIGLVAGAATGGTAGVAMAVGGAASGVSQAGAEARVSGSLGSNYGAIGIKTPYLIIERPQQSRAANDNKLIGKRANMTNKLGDLKGFTKVLDIHLDGISATDSEKSELLQILNKGVII